jgi:hypothetical protein
MTHDSIGLGEDGPTHQPVEHVMSLRMIPNLNVFRPADIGRDGGMLGAGAGNQIRLRCWRCRARTCRNCAKTARKLQREGRLSPACRRGRAQGGADRHRFGSRTRAQTAEALEARDWRRCRLDAVLGTVRRQDAAYRADILPAGDALKVSIEAGVTLGWERYWQRWPDHRHRQLRRVGSGKAAFRAFRHHGRSHRSRKSFSKIEQVSRSSLIWRPRLQSTVSGASGAMSRAPSWNGRLRAGTGLDQRPGRCQGQCPAVQARFVHGAFPAARSKSMAMT